MSVPKAKEKRKWHNDDGRLGDEKQKTADTLVDHDFLLASFELVTSFARRLHQVAYDYVSSFLFESSQLSRVLEPIGHHTCKGVSQHEYCAFEYVFNPNGR